MAFALIGENERAWELFALLNPMQHGGTAEQNATYKVEPYVIAADVYSVAPHIGRGGWGLYNPAARRGLPLSPLKHLCHPLRGKLPPEVSRFFTQWAKIKN